MARTFDTGDAQSIDHVVRQAERHLLRDFKRLALPVNTSTFTSFQASASRPKLTFSNKQLRST